MRHEQPVIDTYVQQAEKLRVDRADSRERAAAALAVLLGDESEDEERYRAMRRLARQGASLLPLVLETLDRYPEISTPSWPFWPRQYELCSQLLVCLSRAEQMRPGALLHHPAVCQPAGPVLWTSIIEAAGRVPQNDYVDQSDYELLLREGLQSPWRSTRYAAAIALGNLAGRRALSPLTITALRERQHDSYELPLRLAASHTLLRHGVSRGVDVLLAMMDTALPDMTRKAAAFVLASESPLRNITSQQRARLQKKALSALRDHDLDIALYAADILSGIAAPSTLSRLCMNLRTSNSQAQVATLTALENIASRKTMRAAIYESGLPGQVTGLLRAVIPEVRRQAAYTLAAFGGAYAAAVLGATLLNDEPAGRSEAIEGLRLLPDVMRSNRREQVTRWLLYALREAAADGREEEQVIALDSLAYVLWQARRGNAATCRTLSEAVWRDETVPQLLASDSAWVRQRAIELLAMLDAAPPSFLPQLTRILHSDEDSGVRACVAHMFGQIRERQAIPALLLALLDPDEYVVETALNALGRSAAPDDPIVVYVVRELAASCRKQRKDADQLARTARAILREWRG